MHQGRIAVPYDARWAELGARECTRLATVSGGAEHIGTTAVPGCLGSPVIDIMVGVRLLDRRGALVLGALEEMGYTRTASRLPGALALERRNAVAFDVFVVELGGREWKRATALRDYLREHIDDARAYGRGLKEADAAAAVAGDDAVFDAAKQALIATFTARAEKWRLAHRRY